MGGVLDFIFPKVCLGCRGLLTFGEEVLCLGCELDLPLTNHHLQSENEAFKRLQVRVECDKVIAMLYFEKQGIVQELMHNLKYRGHQEIGSYLAGWYLPKIKDLFNDIDYIIPVPLHPKRLHLRGYNQVTTFCATLGNGLSKPVITDLLVRQKHMATQTKKSLFSRTTLAQEVFTLGNNPERYKGAHFLIVDDILTTGTTLEQCIKAMQPIAGSKFSVLTMAYTK